MIHIAHIENDYTSKFGVPRQSGLTRGMLSRIVFDDEYRNPDGLRGIEGFSHLWLLWEFHEAKRAKNNLTVRPPRLGGNRRMGVWATRSPFRPNGIGLSCVRLVKVELDGSDGPVLWVENADLMNGTPILDIKPYLAFTDSHPDASAGWTELAEQMNKPLEVEISNQAKARYPFSPQQWATVCEILSQDPRPHYKTDGNETVYSFEFAHHTISFKVNNQKAIIL